MLLIIFLHILLFYFRPSYFTPTFVVRLLFCSVIIHVALCWIGKGFFFFIFLFLRDAVALFSCRSLLPFPLHSTYLVSIFSPSSTPRCFLPSLLPSTPAHPCLSVSTSIPCLHHSFFLAFHCSPNLSASPSCFSL